MYSGKPRDFIEESIDRENFMSARCKIPSPILNPPSPKMLNPEHEPDHQPPNPPSPSPAAGGPEPPHRTRIDA